MDAEQKSPFSAKCGHELQRLRMEVRSAQARGMMLNSQAILQRLLNALCCEIPEEVDITEPSSGQAGTAGS